MLVLKLTSSTREKIFVANSTESPIWKIYPADSEIFETFRQPKVYPHYDKDNSMQISVKIMQNLIENEEDFIA